MNQCAQSFKSLDSSHSGKVNRDLYYASILSITKSNDIPVPDTHIITDILDISNSTQIDVMFNEFCVCLFSHSNMGIGEKNKKPTFLVITDIAAIKDAKEKEDKKVDKFEKLKDDDHIIDTLSFKKLILN